MIDFEAIATTELRNEPYEWALVESAIAPAAAAMLIDTFPVEDFWRLSHDDGEKSYTYSARPLVILGGDRPANLAPLPDPWQELVADLLSARYRESLSQALGQPLDDAPMEAAVWRWDRQAELGPHLDMREKLVTHVFYLNGGWNPRWGGCLRILNSKDEDDLAAEIPPGLGTASILVRSEHSWHSVSPVSDPPFPRRSVIVTWFRPGSSSPSWFVDDDGEVQSHARPPGGVREESPATAGIAALEAYAAAADGRAAELSEHQARGAGRAGRVRSLLASAREEARRLGNARAAGS